MADTASDANIPQLAAGADTPKPIKLKKASVNIAWGIHIVMVTIMGPMALGIKCLSNILLVLAP